MITAKRVAAPQPAKAWLIFLELSTEIFAEYKESFKFPNKITTPGTTSNMNLLGGQPNWLIKVCYNFFLAVRLVTTEPRHDTGTSCIVFINTYSHRSPV